LAYMAAGKASRALSTAEGALELAHSTGDGALVDRLRTRIDEIRLHIGG